MKPRKITHRERALFYSAAFPDWPSLQADDRWLSGIWILGNDYRNKTKLYGSYPPNYLKRVQSMFPDCKDILHVCSGALPPGDYTRFDLREDAKPDVVGDVHKLSSYFSKKKFDIIYIDIPYSIEDALHYGTPMVKRKTALQECAKVLKKGGQLVWLDQALPQFAKRDFHWYGEIAIQRSSNHRIRGCYLFEKV